MAFDLVEEMETCFFKQTITKVTSIRLGSFVDVSINLEMKSVSNDEQVQVLHTHSNDPFLFSLNDIHSLPFVGRRYEIFNINLTPFSKNLV